MDKFNDRMVKHTLLLVFLLVIIAIVAVFCPENAGTYCSIAINFLLLIYMFSVQRNISRRHKDLLAEKDKIVQNYEQILITTASDTYKGIRRVDLETGNADYIYFEDYHMKQVDIGDWMEWLNTQDRYINADDLHRVVEFLHIDNLRTMKEGTSYSISYKSASKYDGYYKIYTSVVSVTMINGRKTAIMTTIDNTATVRNEMEQKQLLASVASIYVSVHVFNLKNNTLEVLSSSKHITELVGDRRENAKELLYEIMHKMTDEQYVDAMEHFIDFTTLDERMQGVNTITLEFLGVESGWCRARFIAVDYDESNCLNRVLWVVENIDAEKKKANRLLYLSEMDLMTGIYNRGCGESKIKESIAMGHQGMLCVLDADRFKSINDSFGHGVGDKVLIAIANALKASSRESDVVMRLGGDEFALFADGVTDRKNAENIIRRFIQVLEDIEIPELGERKIEVSVGAAFKTSGDGLDFEMLYRNADSCAYNSKKTQGNSYTFFET